MFKLIFIGIIKFYKKCISPLLPHRCIYQPSCSTYGLTAIRRFGAVKGGYLALRRIFRCHPLAKGGFDPVPDNLKGEIKWLI